MRDSGLRAACWLHRQCLRLAPRRFRRQFGAEAEEAFRRLVDDTRRKHGAWAAVSATTAGVFDAIGVAARERLSDTTHAAWSGLWIDISRAPRVYWRSPVIAAAITAILALAAGPVVALCTVLYQGVLAPLPYPDADRLVTITHASQYGRNLHLPAASVGDYRTVDAFASVSGVRPLANRVTFDGEPRLILTFQVTAGALTMLGVPLAAGRDLRPGEDRDEVAVVTRGFAQAHFGTVDAAIGRTLTLISSTPTIVGVLDYQPRLPGGPPFPAELFTPHRTADLADIPRRGSQAIVIARLREGVTIEQAEAQVRTVAAGVRAVHGGDDVVPALEPLRDAVSGPMRLPMLLLFAAVGALFLIAVSSLASLVLARAASRVSDVVLRRSLGATRWRLTRVWLLEGLALAIPGVALGSWLAVALLRIARAVMPQGMIPGLDTTSSAFVSSSAAVLLAVTTVLFALAPVVAGVLKASATSSTQGSYVAGLRRMRAQNLLIVGQVSLSVVLVTCSLWLSLAFSRTLSRSVGFDPDGLATVQVQSQRDSVRDMAVVARAREAFSTRFGDAGVAAASGMPGLMTSGFVPVRIRPDQDALPEDARPTLVRFSVSPNYFSLLGIPMVEGRPFTADDELSPNSTIILSRAFAARWFPEGAVGQTVSFSLNPADRRVVVGVVEDVHANSIASDAGDPTYYTPSTTGPIDTYIVRTSRPLADIRADAGQIFRELDPSATLLVLSARDAMAYPLAPRLTAQRAVMALALLALALAIVNVYALSAFSVVQRSREIGIRIALGATTTDTLRLVMRRSFIAIACGLAIGAPATIWLAGPALRAQLANLPIDEPLLPALAVVVVSGMALLASWLPARRAASIDPAVTLRTE